MSSGSQIPKLAQKKMSVDFGSKDVSSDRGTHARAHEDVRNALALEEDLAKEPVLLGDEVRLIEIRAGSPGELLKDGVVADIAAGEALRPDVAHPAGERQQPSLAQEVAV
jgi:hypothetical protein